MTENHAEDEYIKIPKATLKEIIQTIKEIRAICKGEDLENGQA